jgi:predicted small secreted protein
MNTTAILAMIAALSLVGCNTKAGSRKDAKPSIGRGMPLSDFQALAKERGTKPETLRTTAVSGRWEGRPGAVAGIGYRHLELTLSKGHGFSLDLVGRDVRSTANVVDVDVRGATTWDETGILSGRGKGARPPLKEFGSWRASFPRPATMRLVGSEGTAYDLTHRGG